MFVLSMKTTRPRILATVATVVLLVATVTALSFGSAWTAAAPVRVPAETDRVAYLHGLGYEVADDGEVREVLIPAEFDEQFTAYNALQQAAGMDLSPYRGKRVRCWTYEISNYPGDGAVQAHIYVYKDQVIGGDISSTAQGGFSHGLQALVPGADSPGKEEEHHGTAG